jgi:hypothetical protein
LVGSSRGVNSHDQQRLPAYGSLDKELSVAPGMEDASFDLGSLLEFIRQEMQNKCRTSSI